MKRIDPRRLYAALKRRAQGISGTLDAFGPPAPRASDTQSETRILLVCHGNICRSPMAEDVLRRRLASEGLLGRVTVDSAGVAVSNVGGRPDLRARDRVRREGGSIRDIRARGVSREDFESFDLIIAMDERNKEALLEQARDESDRARVHLLLEFAGGDQIPDPVEGGPADFKRVYDDIERGADGLVTHLKGRLSPR